MCRRKIISGLSMPMFGMLLCLAMTATPAAHAGGWLKKVLNAQIRNPNSAYPQQGNRQAQLLDYNVTVSVQGTGQLAQAKVEVTIQPGDDGMDAVVDAMRVRYTLVDLHGQSRGQVTKMLQAASPSTIKSTLDFTPPRGIPHGRYRVDAELLINGSPRATRSAEYQII